MFVEQPATPMDNNASERALRAPAISRKVSFGSHSETGARLSAVLFSLFATLALAGINRHHWLLDYLHACAANAGEAPATPRPLAALGHGRRPCAAAASPLPGPPTHGP